LYLKQTIQKGVVNTCERFAIAEVAIRIFNNGLDLNLQEIDIQMICATFGIMKGIWASIKNFLKNRKK